MIIIGFNSNGKELKNEIIKYLDNEVYEIENDDIYELSIQVANKVLENNEHKGIIIDEFGILPFMIASKLPHIICATCNDSHSAKMTRDHNNTNILTLGCKVVGSEVANEIVKRFVHGKYAGGRHQIRIDMLEKMVNV